MFGHVVDMAVEGDSVGDAESMHVLDQPLAPPTATDDIEVQTRDAGPQFSDRVQRVLDLLVRHQPGQHNHPRDARPRAGQRLRRRLVKTVAHHRDPLVVHAERNQIPR